MTVIKLFGNVWGCGPNIAKQWYDQVRIFCLFFRDRINFVIE
jgi:hypothetical protein